MARSRAPPVETEWLLRAAQNPDIDHTSLLSVLEHMDADAFLREEMRIGLQQAADDKIAREYISPTIATVSELDDKFRVALARSLKLSPMPQYETPSAIRYRLKLHQKFGLGRIMQWVDTPGCYGGIIADDMGLGKTLLAIAAICARPPTHRNPAMVIVPAGLLRNWKREFETFLKQHTSLKVCFLHETIPGFTKRSTITSEIYRKINVFVIPEQQIVKEAEAMDKIEKAREYGETAEFEKTPSILCLGREFSMVFVDEAHHMSNPNANLARALKHIDTQKWFFLTGSLFRNHTQDVMIALRYLRMVPFDNKENFRKFFVDQGKYSSKKSQARLTYLLTPYMIRRFKDDYGELFPQKEVKMVEHEMGTVAEDLLEATNGLADMFNFTLAADSEGYQQSLRERQAVCHPLLSIRKLHSINGEEKPQCLNADNWDLIRSFFRTHGKPTKRMEVAFNIYHQYTFHDRKNNMSIKTIFFSPWKRLLDLFQIYLESMGVDSDTLFRIDGGIPSKDREARLWEHRDAPKGAILLATTGVLIEGHNIPWATQVIFLNETWCPANEAQAQNRCHRMGQKHDLEVYVLHCFESRIEKKMRERRLLKMQHQQNIVDGSFKKPEFARPRYDPQDYDAWGPSDPLFLDDDAPMESLEDLEERAQRELHADLVLGEDVGEERAIIFGEDENDEDSEEEEEAEGEVENKEEEDDKEEDDNEEKEEEEEEEEENEDEDD